MEGLGDKIANGFQSFAGNIPKAMLIVRNPEKMKPVIYNKFKGKSAKDRAKDKPDKRAKIGSDSMKLLGKMQDEMIKKYNSNKGEAVRFDDAKSVRNDLTKEKLFVVMEVQYNPSKLRLDTSAGHRTSMKDNELTSFDYPVATTLNVQLVFDDMNVHDAFMLSNLAPSAGNIYNGVKDIMGGDGSMEGDKNFSVQVQMDGIMALLHRVETRYVMFAWSGMFFYGELTSVTLRYTMFNKKGCPVRGTADLQIRQAREVSTDNKVIDYWDKAYKEFFDEYDTTKGGFSAINNNILNLNL